MNTYTGNGITFGMGFGTMASKILTLATIGAAVWFIVRVSATILSLMGN